MTQILEGSADWFAARCGIPTASVAADLLSEGRTPGSFGKPYQTLLDSKCWESYAGESNSSGTGFAAERGLELEPQALQMYATERGVRVEKPGLLFHKTLMFAGTPDGLVGDDGTIQVKCPLDGAKINRIRTRCEIEEYRDQIQAELCITGRAWCDLVIFDPRLPPDYLMTVIRIPRDEAHIARIEARVRQFNEDLKALRARFEAGPSAQLKVMK